MPTKTDRILSYLPQTFLTSPRPEVLYPVADAFGNELLLGENSLAAIMLSHWVDFADKNALQIDDLARIAALYGLAPWRDESGESVESVEEFREHLKRYVRTFLEGTVTVQGILRVTAEALALRIADETDQLDRWWTRRQDRVVTIEQRGDDAAPKLRFEASSVHGHPALPARVTGSVDLSDGINLQGANILRLKIDGVSSGEIDLTEGTTPGALLTPDQIVAIINQAPRPKIAYHDGRHLILASPQSGPGSRLEVLGGAHDAAPRLLGLAPRLYRGTAATSAQLKGTVELSQPVDLSLERFLRLEVDGEHLAEIDCADVDAAHTSLNHIRDAINAALGKAIASHDGHFLILTSPTQGFSSSISVQLPAAQNAAKKILGAPTALEHGQEAQPARADSTRDLRGGVDLGERSNIRLKIDGAAPVTINCAGVNPSKTERVEIVAAINAAVKAQLATITERSISVVSPTAGPAGELIFEPTTNDATSDIFGIGSLSFQGSAPTKARLAGTPLLTAIGGVDVRAQHILLLAVDGATPIEIDLRRAAETMAELESLPLDKLAQAINQALHKVAVASTDGQRILLASPTIGGLSKLEILPLENNRERRFVTRAVVTDEAARSIFGFLAKEAQGTSPTPARVTGAPDLSQSADLQKARFLRLTIDGHPTIEIDCAGGRPRATTLEEIVEKINSELRKIGLTKNVAAHDGKHLMLISPSSGSGSRVVMEPPLVALEVLMGIEPATFQGADETQVKFTGTVDLSAGLELEPQAAIKLGIDGAAPAEIVLGGAAPTHKSPAEIVNAINTALLASVASTDGRRIELRSAKKGTDSKIVFQTPAAHDATMSIFGITAPRTYQGAAARPAQVVGETDLSGGVNLSVFRFLRLSIDGAPAQVLDCAAQAAKPEAATLAEIIKSIGAGFASTQDGKHLILTSPSAGSSAQLTLEAYSEGDAKQPLLGDVPAVTSGTPAVPAVIVGDATVLSPVNLSNRRLLRIAVDGGRPVEIDVAGAFPAKTFLDEIVARINHVLPNVASATEDDHLQLTSPGTGPQSSLSLQPLRYLEVQEYLPTAAPPLTLMARHSDSWSVVNKGAADSYAEISITAPQGTVGPTLVNSNLGCSARLFIVLDRHETVRLWRDERRGLQAEIISVDGKTRPVPTDAILVGPLGAQTFVPFKGDWSLTSEGRGPATLQLNNPHASSIVLLRVREPGNEVTVNVLESNLTSASSSPMEADGSTARLVGRLKVDEEEYRLVDASETTIAQLLPGPDINLRAYHDHVVAAAGPLHPGAPPQMLVRKINQLFDVTLHSALDRDPPEKYLGVTIGVGATGEDSLLSQLNVGAQGVAASKLVRAEEFAKASVLSLPRGKTIFRYLDCLGSRFNQARFDHSRFPDGVCGERGIFDVSRFTHVPPERIRAVFASSDPLSDPPVKIEFRWTIFQAGSFVVNLPADLPARFGGRFNETRFGQNKDAPELYAGAVAEPVTDDKFLVELISPASGDKSNFVKASVVSSVDLGWAAFRMPFRKPQFLTLGRPGQAARLYLKEDGLAGFILLEAKEEGTWGNEIAVTARPAGPAIYDVSVIYRGGRFESARAIVLGPQPGELTKELLKPSPVGVLQAKAAGVRADVTRDRAEYKQSTITSSPT